MKYPTAALATALLLALASCDKPAQEPPTPASTQAQPTAEFSVTPAQTGPWYAAKLEALGFYVFPTPEPLPALSVLNLDGTPTTSAVSRGKVTLLNFWATWCPPCRSEMPSIQILYDKTRDVAFDVFAVSVAEPRATVADFLKNNPDFSFPMYLDETGAASAPFVGRGIPTTFILDKQGNAIAGMVGARMYDGPEVIALFRELAERLP
ncbi:MAG: TlpA family protein disulfide reductase [Spirochaetales bacterium]|nr:TlpA family protein disulfide reductase [Spirochaetales bacterium]